MQIKNVTGLVIMILISCGNLVSAHQDEKAREILDKLAGHTRSSPSLFVDFTFSMTSQKDDISEEFDGQITMKGNKYRLSIMNTEIWFDGESMYTYLPDVNEVIISEPDEDGGLMSNPAELFSIYHEEFRYSMQGETTGDGKSLYEIDLHPIDLEQDFHTVKLFVDRKNSFIHSAIIAGKDGNRYMLTVNNFNNTRQVADSYFVFDKSKFPGIEIIDMRW
jgi:outer membrane lipoprotein carrier protein